jgi:excisionase family DNA binding protein
VRAAELPAYLTITQLADVLGLTRRSVRYRVEKGTIPSTKMGDERTARRVVFLATLKRDFPELWEAVVMKTDVLSFHLDDASLDEDDN